MAKTKTKTNLYDIEIWNEVVYKKSMTVRAESSEQAKELILQAIEDGDAPWDIAEDFDEDGKIKSSSMDLYLVNDEGDDEFIVEFGD